MKKKTYNRIKEKLDSLEKLLNGGKGSGNFGHGGRPGKVGGSGKGGGESSKESTKLQKRILDLEGKISRIEKDFEGNKRTKIDMLHTKRALMEELSQARLDWAMTKRKEKQTPQEKLMAGYYVKDVHELKRIRDNKKALLKSLKQDIKRYEKEYKARQEKYEKTGEWGWDNPGFSLMAIDKAKKDIEKTQKDIKKIDKYLKSQDE